MVFINEFHYDNVGTDAGEFIEIAGLAGTDLTGWSLVLYNGNGGQVYDTIALGGSIPDLQNGFGVQTYFEPGIQNGSPDGIALVDDTNTVVQFLSYEGSFTAVGGPANGMTSTDIGVSEPSDSPLGFSLQFTGTGNAASDFTWAAAAVFTPGLANTGQTFEAPPAFSFDMQVTEIWPGQDGTDLTADWFEITNVGTGAWVSGVDPDLFYDDDSADPTAADQVFGLTDIQPGESVIVVIGTQADATQFFTVWSPDVDLGSIEIGWTDGASLGQGGDTVTLFLGSPTTGTIVESEAYPDAAGNSGRSWDVVDLAFSTVGNAAGAVETTATAGTSGTEPAIGSPGRVAAPSAFTPIYDIQGAAHTSPLLGQTVTTTGVVTAVDSNGFYLQDPVGDGDSATSDAIFVFTGSAPGVTVRDAVEVSGTVSEFVPGGPSTGNLSTTQIGGSPTVNVLSTNNDLPAATIIGASGRVPPERNIDDDAFTVFDPDTAGIDFFESLEGMLVTASDLVAVAGTNGFGEIFAVADQGADASGISQRGTLNISPDDFNPEKIQIDEDTGILPGFTLPQVDVGALLGDVTGVVSYDFGNFQIHPTQAFTATASGLQPETTALFGTMSALTIASYNVLNLDPNDSDGDMDIADGRFTALAQQIVFNLGAPDIIALQEIQDNSGSVDDGVIAADQTLQNLIAEIVGVGGVTYEFIDNTFIGDGTSGGQPGGNIRTAFLYNADRVDVVSGSVQTIGSQGPGQAFEGARLPLVATFTFDGQDITLVNNHFSSKGGSAPILGIEQPFDARQEDPSVNGSLDERQAQSQAVQDFVNGLLGTDPNANVVVLGDLNEFEFVSPVLDLETGAGLTNLTNTLPEDERYTFVFQGNSQSLDHILVSDALAATAEFDIVHVNAEFAETAQRASDHDPLLARFEVSAPDPFFTLQLVHASDLEGGVDAIANAPNFAAIVEALENDTASYDASITLSAGDNYIPGPFFGAAGDASLRGPLREAYQTLFNEPGLTNSREGDGRVDISIMNIIGFDASAVGNHEFDNGPNTFAGLIGTDIRGSTLGDVRWLGAQFPYLSANLDFSGDGSLAPMFTSDIRPNTDFRADLGDVAGSAAPPAPKLAPATIIEEAGERIGVVGATTQLLETITSNGDVQVIGPSMNDMPALATILQPVIDDVIDGDDDTLGTADDINKIIVVSHLQQIALEQELATLLDGVDIIVAGGSDTILANPDDPLQPGDVAEGPYPIVTADASGNPAVIVSTDGEYSYVGRLVVDFDADGILVDANGNPIDEVGDLDLGLNGPIATTNEQVEGLWGNLTDPFADGTKGGEVKKLTDAVLDVVTVTDGNVFGETEVYLEGRREKVRTEETNLGNLTADANLGEALKFDPSVAVSIKNGGGIRAQIGVIQDNGDGTSTLLPPPANPDAGKLEGQVSQLDIENALRFNNALTLVTLTPDQLKIVLEHAVAATAPGSTPGQFAQVGGLSLSFDATRQAQVLDGDGNVVVEGRRVQNVALIDEDGDFEKTIVFNGQVISASPVRIVTLNFLADGGDGYPYPAFVAADPAFANRVDLANVLTDAGAATFAAPGTEQDALAEFLVENHGIGDGTPFDEPETDPSEDERIQNLGERSDAVPDGFTPARTGTNDPDILRGGRYNDLIDGRGGDDRVYGFNGDDVLHGGSGNDRMFGGVGDDFLNGESGNDSLDGGVGNDLMLGGAGNDALKGGLGDDVLKGEDGNDDIEGGLGNDLLIGGAGNDDLDGGQGDDELQGGTGNDNLFGGLGNDVLIGGLGRDSLNGGLGTDTASYADLAGPVRVDLAAGRAYSLAGGGMSLEDHLISIENATGTDLDDVFVLDGGSSVIDGGGGFDVAFLAGDLEDYAVSTMNGTVTLTRGFQTKTLMNVEAFSFGGIALTLAGRAAGLDGAEIVAHDPASQRLFVTSAETATVQVLNIGDPAAPTPAFTIDPAADLNAGFQAGEVTSVAVSNGLVAVAVTAMTVTDPGRVAFYDTGGAFLGDATVGALPDMVTFTPDGTKVLVANEGEPDGGVDPEGSISIIDVSGGVGAATVTTLGFTDFNNQVDPDVRIFPGKTVAQDVEPEYIAVSPDGTTAFVTLQEANAFAVVDLDDGNPSITDILPLGAKDHSLAGNGLDASDKDGAIAIQPWPVFGMFMPDGVASYAIGDETYYVTANEGDARDEDARVKDLTLDPTAFPNAAVLQEDENLGRLEVSTIDGDTDGDGDVDQLFSYGARSFSIWDSSGALVFDSGDAFEQITASQLDPTFFNDNGVAGGFDTRSDSKGPEPEGVAVGQIGGDIYAFIGLERVGGIMVYEVTDPTSPEFVQYINTREDDVAPEGLAFIAAGDSPTGNPLLAVSFEESASVALYDILIQ